MRTKASLLEKLLFLKYYSNLINNTVESYWSNWTQSINDWYFNKQNLANNQHRIIFFLLLKIFIHKLTKWVIIRSFTSWLNRKKVTEKEKYLLVFYFILLGIFEKKTINCICQPQYLKINVFYFKNTRIFVKYRAWRP